ncbi:hypothetical protein C8R45DRAFT_1073605 [Mycena sanguinolenta]|nr:hypothetical protein C8R45DRAFT_1073605 [Mycena sanguinolenta]
MSRSYEETQCLFADIEDMPTRHLPFLLTVLYAPLDPARIAAVLAGFDSSGWLGIRSQIDLVYRCLSGIFYLGLKKAIPRAAFVDLWHRSWPWIEFLDQCDECLPSDDPHETKSKPLTEDLITGTGSRADLASTIISHITRSIHSELMGHHLIGALYMVANHGDWTLGDTLLSCGIVTALTTATLTLCRGTVRLSEAILAEIFPILMEQSSFSPVYMAESFRAGLLEIVFVPPLRRRLISRFFCHFLEDTLPACTVYYSVLVQLQTSFPQVRDRDAATIFRDDPLLGHWQSFTELVEDRLRLLDEYSTGA